MSVTVAVPYFANQDGLDRLLTALSRQTLPGPWRVVVADDGSPEPPRLDVAGDVPVTVLSQPDLGFRAAAARNLAATAAPADFLIFLDADMVPEPDYLATMIAALQRHDVVVGRRRHADFTGWDLHRLAAWLDGRTTGPTPLAEPAWLAEGYRASDQLADSDHRSYRYLISAVLGVRGELFARVGGFDETFVGYGGEDWEFAHRCWLAGADWRHVPQAVAWHQGPDLAGRGADADRRAVLAEQTDRLARVLPDPAARPGRGETEVPSVAVLVDAAGLSSDELAVLLDGLAPGGEVHVWVTGAPELPSRPGVHPGRPTPRDLARIPVLLDADAVGRRTRSRAAR